MTLAKTTLFSADQVALAQFAAALSHPARIAIIHFLRAHGRASCGEIVAHLPLSQPTVSQHLKTLLETGLLTQESVGQKMLYQLDCDRMLKFCHSFQCSLGTREKTA